MPMGMQGLSTFPQTNLKNRNSPYGHITNGESSSWQKDHPDQSKCYHGNSSNRLPSLTEEQRVQQYQNNQHLNVEGWPLLPSAQSSQTHFMTLGRRNIPQPHPFCNRSQPNHRINALSRFVTPLY